MIGQSLRARRLAKSKFNTLAELRAGELGYGVLEVESRFSVEEKVACSCWEGRLEALQLGFTPTSRSGNTMDTKNNQQGNRRILQSCGKQMVIVLQ